VPASLTELQPLAWALGVVVVALLLIYTRKPSNKVANRMGNPLTATTDHTIVDDLFENSPLGYVETDQKGIIKRVNRRECELRGLALREMVGKHCADLIPPSDRQRYREQVDRRISGQVALVPYQCKYVRPDTSIATVEVHEQLLRNKSSQVVGLRMAAMDMTERKKNEDRAYETATEMRALFQAFPDLFMRVDREGRVMDCKGGQSNDPFLTLERFSGRKLTDILPPVVVDALREAQDRVRKTSSVEVVEFTVEQKQGAEIYEARLLPLHWDQWIGILRNITARKNDEKKVQEYAQELKRKNEELEGALVTAREATQLKNRFLANMSHELRTPLNGVLGMTDFLLGTPLAREQQEYAESIKRSGDSLLAMINDILDFSKIEAGKLQLDRVPFYLSATIGEVATLFAGQAQAKGLEFTSLIPADLPNLAAGDPGRLRQVLINLLSNAIKFTEHGRIGLRAELLAETHSAIRIRFTVQDTGIGISKDEQSRVFASFIQVDGSSTRKYGGVGLGLALSKELVTLLGGEIGLASEPGKGSRFWFTVSLGKPVPGEAPPEPPPSNIAKLAERVAAVAPPPPPAPTVKPIAIPPAATAMNDGLRVLLAEDNEINQRITMRLLQKLGLTADAVINGKDAVEALEKSSYDLIFMDCQMPVMDGFEATAIIRNREGKSRRVPICALTANAMEGDRERCIAAGMDDYITKPVGLDKLQKAVDRWTHSGQRTPAGIQS
jgi:PAS domain S-box-containing protein